MLNPQIAQMLMAMAQRQGPTANPKIIQRPQLPPQMPYTSAPQQQQAPSAINPGLGSFLEATGNALLAQSDRGGSFWGNLGRSLPYGSQALGQHKMDEQANALIDQMNLPEQMKATLRMLPAAQKLQALMAQMQPGEDQIVPTGAAVVRDGQEVYKNVRAPEDEDRYKAEGERFARNKMQGKYGGDWELDESPPEHRAEFAAYQDQFRRAGVPGAPDLTTTEFAKYYIDVVKDDMTAISTTYEQAVPMQQMLSLLEDPDLPSGTLAGAEIVLGQVMESLGAPMQGTSEGEVFRALSNVMAINKRNPEGGAGLPGQMSDKDVEFLRAMVPRLENTREGNIRLLEYNLRVMDHLNELRQARIDYFNRNRTLEGFSSKEWANAHPIFSESDAVGAEGADERLPAWARY